VIRKRRNASPAKQRQKGNRDKMGSRQSVISFAGERSTRVSDRGRIDAGARRERKQETLIIEHMLQHSDKKAGLLRGLPDFLNGKPAGLEESGQPFRLLADKGKGLNRQHFRRFFVRS